MVQHLHIIITCMECVLKVQMDLYSLLFYDHLRLDEYLYILQPFLYAMLCNSVYVHECVCIRVTPNSDYTAYWYMLS